MLGYILASLAFVGITFSAYWLPKPIIQDLILENFDIIISRKKTDVKTIALTIDDVPYGNSFKLILDVLDKHEVKATFFTISDYVKDDNKELIIEAIKNGHEFANHGKTNRMHARLSKDKIKEEIEECDQKLRDIYKEADKEPTGIKFYRPGTGLFNKKMLKIVDEKNMKLALGSVYPHDPQVPFSTINFWYIKKKIESGDILILHDRSWTPSLLDELLPWLKKKGYIIETLGQFSNN